ncbi:MAG: LysR substrate-binding domain-containing protein [Gammaproteobacteria bacterium]|nr:LysR substrate-binding domain-containing protein [Gammaproteobacteria bacterium]
MSAMRYLPSFAGLRAFDAAARHLSFREAAEELCVTQSAISHQIRGLEDFLGCKLFLRGHNRINLSPAGERYLKEISVLLDGLESASRRIACAEGADRLVVQATPAFAARWLLPRLDRFTELCPQCEISITTGLPPTEFSGGALDVVIHWGAEAVDGVRVDPFFASARFPVASPKLIERYGHPSHPASLRDFPLLRDEVQDGWEDWFRNVGVPPQEQPTAPSFAHCELVLNAAESGLGVALAYGRLVSREIAHGKLVKLFDIDSGPYLIYSVASEKRRSNEPLIAAFRDWIVSEGQADEAGLGFLRPVRSA